MVFFTLALFRQAVRQNTIAEKNIALADSLFKLSKKQFDSTITSSKEASENARQNFLLQEKSVHAQIQAFRAAQKEFEIENRPFIAITNITIDTAFTNNVVTCSL